MTMMEQFKKDCKVVKELKGADRWEYIWDYYKIPIVSVVFVIFVVAYSIGSAMTRGEFNLYAVLVNSNPAGDSTCMTELLRDAGYDMDRYQVAVEANYTVHPGEGMESDMTTLQVLAAQFSIGDLDLFVADKPVFDMYTKQGGFENVGLLLPMEMKEKYAEDLYSYELEDGSTIVGGVWLHKGSALHEAGYYSEDVIVGIASQAQNLDEALVVLTGLLKSNP